MALRALHVFMALGLAATGCLQRSLPVPPPSVTSQSIEECPASECPDGGVVVTFVGEAFPLAEVILEDRTPLTVGPRGEVLGGVARADATGAWRFTLTPQRDLATGAVRAPRRGDTVSIYQVTAPPDSEVSGVREVVVGR
ncbi:MAG: hypothetical protein R3A52_08520 [Polyangiales bacterium]